MATLLVIENIFCIYNHIVSAKALGKKRRVFFKKIKKQGGIKCVKKKVSGEKKMKERWNKMYARFKISLK